MVKSIVRLYSRPTHNTPARWLVQLVNGSTAVMTASGLLADLRSRSVAR